jgi:hypothetical protein
MITPVDQLSPEDQAVYWNNMITELEEQLKDAKQNKAFAIMVAINNGVRSHGGFVFYKKFEGGKQTEVEETMLAVEFPKVHAILTQRAIDNLKLKVNKSELEEELKAILPAGEVQGALLRCCIEKDVPTQFLMKKGSE